MLFRHYEATIDSFNFPMRTSLVFTIYYLSGLFTMEENLEVGSLEVEMSGNLGILMA